MKFNIPKIIRPLEMSEYDEAMEGLALQVWVNPPSNVNASYWKVQAELAKLSKEFESIKEANAQKITEISKKITKSNLDVFAWFSNIWSQDSNPDTHVSIEELEVVADEDPALYGFMTHNTTRMIREHRDKQRKN